MDGPTSDLRKTGYHVYIYVFKFWNQLVLAPKKSGRYGINF